MLTYEQCVALRDAGFPQDAICWWCRNNVVESDSRLEWFSSAEARRVARNHRPELYVACPNSDELFAAIVNEWPDNVPHVGRGWTLREPQKAYWTAHDDEYGSQCFTGDTPAAALAALYLALKEATR